MSSKFLVLSASLHPESKSRILAQTAYSSLKKAGEAAWWDAREHPLSFPGSPGSWSNPETQALATAIQAADGILVATPIYNYSANAVAKAALELGGKGWENKVVGFLAAAGGSRSYMSLMPLANSLMLDFRAIIIPRFVYAEGGDFAEGQVANADVTARVEELARTLAQFTGALASRR